MRRRRLLLAAGVATGLAFAAAVIAELRGGLRARNAGSFEATLEGERG